MPRAYFDFCIRLPGGYKKTASFFGLRSKEEIKDVKYGSYYDSPAQYNDSKQDEIRGYCETPDLEGFMTSLIRALKLQKVPFKYRERGIVYDAITTSDLMSDFTDREKTFLKSQGFTTEDGNVYVFNPNIQRTLLPQIANNNVVTTTTKPPKGSRPSLTSIVDEALTSNAYTKNEIIEMAHKIYNEKTADQLRVTITSLISTSVGRNKKRLERGVKGSDTTYHLVDQ